jgi:HemY protein
MMIRRLITIVLLLVIAGFITSFLQGLVGDTRIEWLGWRVQAPTSLMVVIAVVAVALMVFLAYLISCLVAVPIWISTRFSRRRLQHGNHALALGLVAASTGDGREALRQSKRAQRLLGDDTLTNLLSAQAASLTGDRSAARRFFEALAEDPATAFLGKAGVMRLEAESGNDDAALAAGREAFMLNKKAPSLAKGLFTLEARHGHWQEAIAALKVASQDPEMNKDDSRAAFATLYYHLAEARFAQDNDAAAALKELNRALKHDSGFIPAVLAASRHYLALNKLRKNLSVLESGFASNPHPTLAQGLIDGWSATNWGNGVKALGKLIATTEKHGNHPESLLCTARLAMNMSLWGEALRLINLIPEEKRNTAAWQILADLAEHEHDSGASNTAEKNRYDRMEALTRAATAPRELGWRCSACTAEAAAWQAQCDSCGGFAQINYR